MPANAHQAAAVGYTDAAWPVRFKCLPPPGLWRRTYEVRYGNPDRLPGSVHAQQASFGQGPGQADPSSSRAIPGRQYAQPMPAPRLALPGLVAAPPPLQMPSEALLINVWVPGLANHPNVFGVPEGQMYMFAPEEETVTIRIIFEASDGRRKDQKLVIVPPISLRAFKKRLSGGHSGDAVRLQLSWMKSKASRIDLPSEHWNVPTLLASYMNGPARPRGGTGDPWLLVLG